MFTLRVGVSAWYTVNTLAFWRRKCYLNFSTGTKYVRIMKQTAFLREKNGDYIPCLQYSVPIFVE